MGSFSDTPSLVAAADINPYRAVKASSSAGYTRHSGSESSAATDYIIGVADGSTKSFNSSLHAAAGDAITLQGGAVILVQTGSTAAIACGNLLKLNGDGRFVVGGGSGDVNWAIALEPSSAANLIIRARILATPRTT